MNQVSLQCCKISRGKALKMKAVVARIFSRASVSNQQTWRLQTRLLSTSTTKLFPKQGEVHRHGEVHPGLSEVAKHKIEPAAEPTKKTWQSFGYDWEDEDTDRTYARIVFFSTVTIGLVLVGFILAYWPDHQLRNWSQREAHIELARREALGLPHIDPNLVPPESVHLPSEEELGDFEIII